MKEKIFKKYFAFDPDGGNHYYFDCLDEAENFIDECVEIIKKNCFAANEGEWPEDMEEFCIGEITQRLQRVDIKEKSKLCNCDNNNNGDVDNCPWHSKYSDDHDSICEYQLVPVKKFKNEY